MVRFIYLHGFASSPMSRKAVFFRDRLEEERIPLEIPDLAEGRFRELTLTGQLDVIARAAGTDTIFLIGSSMGGYLASLYAARHQAQVVGLVLLAPAFCFGSRWPEVIGPERVADWRRSGELTVYHYGEGREMPLGPQLLEDAQRFEAYPACHPNTLILHGTEDTVVPVELSEEFHRRCPATVLIKLRAGHEMTDVLPEIWQHAKPLVLQAAAASRC